MDNTLILNIIKLAFTGVFVFFLIKASKFATEYLQVKVDIMKKKAIIDRAIKIKEAEDKGINISEALEKDVSISRILEEQLKK